jgi:hypothetical protein
MVEIGIIVCKNYEIIIMIGGMKMKRICNQCKTMVGKDYRINASGDIFCNDDCYEDYMNDNEDAPDDNSHPYIDDYAGIRFEFLEFLKDFQELDYFPAERNIQYELDGMLDAIDSVLLEYQHYYFTEGEDGIFAKEIYSYYLRNYYNIRFYVGNQLVKL